MKKQLTKGLLFVCTLAVMGMMAACGGNESTTAASGDDEMHIDAERLAKMNVEKTELEKKITDLTDSLKIKYEDSTSFVKLQLIYIEELQKLDIEQDFRDYLTETEKFLKGEISAKEYYGFDPSEFEL